MTKIERFEDIEAWRKARMLTRELYQITSSGRFIHHQFLRDQLLRASVSIMSNIAEGFGRGGDREFRQFLSLAIGSTREVQNQLYVALDMQLVDEDQFRALYTVTEEIARLIGGLMRYLASSSLKGSKYAGHG